jgi:hypothetical protein
MTANHPLPTPSTGTKRKISSTRAFTVVGYGSTVLTGPRMAKTRQLVRRDEVIE